MQAIKYKGINIVLSKMSRVIAFPFGQRPKGSECSEESHAGT